MNDAYRSVYANDSCIWEPTLKKQQQKSQCEKKIDCDVNKQRKMCVVNVCVLSTGDFFLSNIIFIINIDDNK